MAIGEAEMLLLRRLNTPTIYNGWEAYTRRDRLGGAFNLEETRDFMPQMGPMVGRAVTCAFEPSNPDHPKRNPNAWAEYREYVASVPGPKILILQDLDKPRCVGSFWGEVNAGAHRALGCVGTITDGAIRDVDEMTQAGFKAIARRLCVSHAYSCPGRWGCEVEVFGCRVQPGRLIHADKHGFLIIPPEDEDGLIEAAQFMDANECRTVIPAAQFAGGLPLEEILRRLDQAGAEFGRAARERFYGGEWSGRED